MITNAAALPQRISHPVYEWAEKTPDAIAVFDNNVSHTYQQLESACRVLREYLDSLGVRAGDRILIVTENCFETIALILAAGDMDAWPIPLNARLSPSELDAIIEHSGARRIFFTTGISSKAAEHARRLGAETCNTHLLKRMHVSSLNDNTCAETVYEENHRQVGVIIYTSGTTGSPKGVMLSHKNLSWVAHTTGKIRGMNTNDKVYACLPISHSFGLTSTTLGTLYAGGCIYTVSEFDPAHIVQALDQEGVTVFQGVPPMYAKILDYLKQNNMSLLAPDLRYISSGGAPLDIHLKQAVQGTFGLYLNNGYGLTETGPTLAQTRIETPRDNTSIGALLPEMEVRFTNSDGQPVDPKTGGVLHVRGPNVMIGYYRAPELTAGVLDEEAWFNTGDLAKIDECNDLHIIGRAKEMIIRSGFNVYPEEVEAAINTHPAVTLSGVVGVTTKGNEEVVAFLQKASGVSVTENEIHAFLRDKLAPYKIPAKIHLMDELPASSTGKIRKDVLRNIAVEARNS